MCIGFRARNAAPQLALSAVLATSTCHACTPTCHACTPLLAAGSAAKDRDPESLLPRGSVYEYISSGTSLQVGWTPNLLEILKAVFMQSAHTRLLKFLASCLRELLLGTLGTTILRTHTAHG